MLSSARSTMSQAIPTATMAGARMAMLPVICATMSMTAIGAREMPPNTAIIPTTTNGAGS